MKYQCPTCGHVSPALRDRAIFEDHDKGMSTIKLAARHCVTVARIGQVIRAERRRRGLPTVHANKPDPKRDAAMLAMKKTGSSFRTIGARYGISGERVRQIINRSP